MSGKCDELKDKWFNAYPEIMGIEGDEPTQCYGKADVDAAIDELKDENATLRGANDEKSERIVELQKQVDALKQKLQDQCVSCPVKEQEDDVVAELKAKLNEAEEARYEAGADAADYYQENRKLKRALWLERARRADEIHYMWCQLIYDKKYGIVKFNVKKRWWAEDLKQGQTLHTPQGWADVWDEVEYKCRKKAEEYK